MISSCKIKLNNKIYIPNAQSARLRLFGGFGGPPQSQQLCLGVLRKRLVSRRFHVAEAAVELVAGAVQGVLGIHPGHLADLGGHEQGIAQFLPYAVGGIGCLAGLQSLTQLPDFLLQFGEGVQRAAAGGVPHSDRG